MIIDNMQKQKYHKYFRIGDIVQNEGIWGKKKFVIHGFGGNSYLAELYVHEYGAKKITIGNSCNWDVRDTKLINADKRPLRKLSTKLLTKLLKKDNEDAKREFIIRTRKI